jgi:hypothetical protein
MVLNEEQILHPDISIAISPNASFLVVATSHTVRTFFDERCPALGAAPPYSPPPAPQPPPRPLFLLYVHAFVAYSFKFVQTLFSAHLDNSCTKN